MTAVLHRPLTLVLAATAAVLFASPAFAQRGSRNASAEAFSFCREQEKAGDARACWRVWLEKYRATGSEAELAYAEAHPEAPNAPARTARLQLTSTPSAALTLDGRPLGLTPKDGVEVSPGEHRITFANRWRIEGRTITVAAGEARVVDVQFDPPPPTPTPRIAPPSSGVPSGDILDFCAPSPATGARKERVVLFAPSGTRRMNNDVQLRAVDGARLVREVFTARFAVERFRNVLSSFPARTGWEKRDSLSLGELRAFLREAREQGEAGPEGAGVRATSEHEGRTDRERRFLAYSVECADYIAVPTITSHETKWTSSRVTQEAATPSKVLSFAMNGALAIFRRKGQRFERIALLSASAPSPVASGSAMTTTPEMAEAGPYSLSPAAKVPRLPPYVSGVPDPKCFAERIATDAVAGLAACATAGEGTVEQTLGSLDERLGTECAKSRDEGTPDKERLTLSVQCELRSRSYELARALQEEARKVDGWRLFGVLAHASSPPSLALGREDGVKIGDAFQVRGEHDERLAFFKVAQVGPGGAAGEKDPSLLHPVSGEAPTGARLDVYPQLGLVIAPYASFALVTYCDGTTRVQGSGTFQDFTLPSVVFGGGATLGYDISSLLNWTDAYARVGGGVFTGSGLNTSAVLVPLDLWFEKGFYLARRLLLTAAIGGTVQRSSVNVLTAMTGVAEDLHVSSTRYGPAARVGLDVMLHPDWSVKIEAAARVPLNSASYSESDGKAVPAEWQSRDDHFATIAANLGIARTF